MKKARVKHIKLLKTTSNKNLALEQPVSFLKKNILTIKVITSIISITTKIEYAGYPSFKTKYPIGKDNSCTGEFNN